MLSVPKTKKEDNPLLVLLKHTADKDFENSKKKSLLIEQNIAFLLYEIFDELKKNDRLKTFEKLGPTNILFASKFERLLNNVYKSKLSDKKGIIVTPSCKERVSSMLLEVRLSGFIDNPRFRSRIAFPSASS